MALQDPWGSMSRGKNFSAHGRKERLTPHFVENHTHWKPQVAGKKGVKVVSNPSSKQCFSTESLKASAACLSLRSTGREHVQYFWSLRMRGKRLMLIQPDEMCQSWSFSKLDITSASPASPVTVSGFVLHLWRVLKRCISLGKFPAPRILASGVSAERAVLRGTQILIWHWLSLAGDHGQDQQCQPSATIFTSFLSLFSAVVALANRNSPAKHGKNYRQMQNSAPMPSQSLATVILDQCKTEIRWW